MISSSCVTKTEVDRSKQLKLSSAASKSYSPRGLSDNEGVEADALQVTSIHALGFMILSSSFLLIMYFIDIYFLVRFLYLFAAGFASSKVFFHPIFSRLVRTYTAIQLGVEIEMVLDYGSSGDCFGFSLASILSGIDFSSYLFNVRSNISCFHVPSYMYSLTALFIFLEDDLNDVNI